MVKIQAQEMRGYVEFINSLSRGIGFPFQSRQSGSLFLKLGRGRQLIRIGVHVLRQP